MRKLGSVSVFALLCLAGCKPPASEKLKGPDRSFCISTPECTAESFKKPPPPPPLPGGPEEKAYLAALPPLITLGESEIETAELEYFFLTESGTCLVKKCLREYTYDRSSVIEDQALKRELITFLNDRNNYQIGFWLCGTWPGHDIRIRTSNYEQEMRIDGGCTALKSWVNGGEMVERTFSEASSGKLKTLIEKIQRNARQRQKTTRRIP